MITQYKRPYLFYFLATLIPWACWFSAGYISHLPQTQSYHEGLIAALSFFGLCVPMLVAFVLMAKDPYLKRDVLSRLFTLKSVKTKYLLFTLFFMLGSILLAQAVSLLFGYSPSQFEITGHFTFSSAVFPVWLLLVLAPTLEELGWHSYGTDCLRQKHNLFKTCMIFGLYWGIWHIPLSSIDNYYHSNLVATGWIHSLNFLVSIFPFVIIMNWLYYKTGRNILVTIVFHITAGYFNEIFATHPDTKVIQTVLLTIFSIALIAREREFFFNLKYRDT